jgi:hypothetical protein
MVLHLARGRRVAALAVLFVFLAGLSPAAAAEHGSIYLMRGLANVFSLGLNTLNSQLHAEGIPSTVTGYSRWKSIARTIEARYARDKRATQPIVIIGHSFGADAAIYLARELDAKKIPVALVVTFDVVTDVTVPPNVRRVMNFYTSGFGHLLHGDKGFKGRLENIDARSHDPTIGHLNIEKSPKLHARTIQEIKRAM